MPLRTAISLLACLLAMGCTHSDPGTRWSRHFDASMWGGAAAQQPARPDRWIPEAVLAATIPIGYVYDRAIHERTEDRSSGPVTEKVADGLQVVAPLIPFSIGLIRMSEGDDGRLLEVVVESLGASVAVQQAMAWTVRRERPDGSDDLSFYSGHTAWLFTSTTLLIRILDDPADEGFRPLDALLYVPAVFAGWERIVDNRHWASDVAVGAFMGVFLTNLIWDAHFRADDETRPVILPATWRPGVQTVEDGILLSLEARF